MRFARTSYASLTALALLAAGCGAQRQGAVRLAPHTTLVALQAGPTAAQQALIDRNCPEGAPVVSGGPPVGPTRFVFHEGYVLQHSSRDKIALWVCEQVTKAQLAGDLPRRNPFKPDPELPTGLRAELADYKGSGFDRGHQAPAGDQTVDQTLKDETFFLSNMAPQVPALNQQIWAALEDLVRSWISSGKLTDAKIITGGMFYDPAEDDPATADGLIPFTTIGSGVAVPTHFYKIVVGRKAGDTDLSAIAFVMENRKHPKPFDFGQFIKTIAWIEERTGLNFMPDLNAADANRMESTAPPLWFQ